MWLVQVSLWHGHITPSNPIHKHGSIIDPNDYRPSICIFSKLTAMVLHMNLFGELEERHLSARGHARSRFAQQTIDHIFTLKAITKEA